MFEALYIKYNHEAPIHSLKIVILARLNVKMYFPLHSLCILCITIGLFVSFCVGANRSAIRTYLILFHILVNIAKCMHWHLFWIDMPLNAKWAHLNYPTMHGNAFLGRQVNVYTFARLYLALQSKQCLHKEQYKQEHWKRKKYIQMTFSTFKSTKDAREKNQSFVYALFIFLNLLYSICRCNNSTNKKLLPHSQCFLNGIF